MKTPFIVVFVFTSCSVLLSKGRLCFTILFLISFDLFIYINVKRFVVKLLKYFVYLLQNFNLNTTINRAFSLCTTARVAPAYESGCSTGFVGVGICVYPNNKCSIGFCHQDPFKIPEAFVGVCCIRSEQSIQLITAKYSQEAFN